MQRTLESAGGMCAKARRLVQSTARRPWDRRWPCAGLCVGAWWALCGKKLRHRWGKPWPRDPQRGEGGQFPAPREDQVQGVMPRSRGTGQRPWADFQAGAGGLRLMHPDTGLEA